jgi:hypothetical protein
MRLNDGWEPYHLAAYRRDRRKARFYYVSVWVGLAAAFLSLIAVETLAGVTFDTTNMRNWVLGILRGIGLWGLLIIAMVWSQVGQRVSQPNSDGTSLLPLPEEKQNKG